MNIVKILNHNSIVAKRKDGKEIILTGKGIAYGYKKGDEVNTDLIDKQFALIESNIEVNNNFKMEFYRVYNNLEDDELDATLKIVGFAKNQISGIDDTIYLTLADHIHGIKERFRKNIKLVNPLKHDIQLFYNEEYNIGLKAIEVINDYLNIKMEDDEAATIAIHFVNACFFKDMSKLYDYLSIVKEITEMVRLNFNIKYNTESISYFRFLAHVKYLAQKIIARDNLTVDYINSVLAQSIKDGMQLYYDFAQKISNSFLEKYSYEMNENDILYLSINLDQIVKQSKESDEL